MEIKELSELYLIYYSDGEHKTAHYAIKICDAISELNLDLTIISNQQKVKERKKVIL